MKFLSQAVTFFSVAYGTRSSLKQLRVLTEVVSDDCSTSIKKKRDAVLLDARDTLMFWSLFGLHQVFSAYCEVLVSWLPGYYYIKSIALLLVTFPKLRFTHAAFEKGVVPLLDRCHTEIERRGGPLPMVIVSAYELPFLAADFFLPFSRERPVLEPELRVHTDLPPLPLTPPWDRPRLAHTPGQSASRVESLRRAVGESARRLSSLAQLPAPRGLADWEAWGEESSDDEPRVFDLMPALSGLGDPDEPPSPPGAPRTSLPRISSRRRSSGAAGRDENVLPSLSRGPRAVVRTLAALFSLDAHSPPAGSSLRRRTIQPTPRGEETAEDMYFRHMGARPNRQSAGAALGRKAPMPLQMPAPLPPLRPAPGDRKPAEVALDSSFDDALSSGRISMRRGGGKRR